MHPQLGLMTCRPKKLQDVHQLQASSNCQLMVSLPITSSSPLGLMPAAAVSPKQASAVIRSDPFNLEGQPYSEPKQHAARPASLGIGALSAGVFSDDGQLPSGYSSTSWCFLESLLLRRELHLQPSLTGVDDSIGASCMQIIFIEFLCSLPGFEDFLVKLQTAVKSQHVVCLEVKSWSLQGGSLQF